MKAIETVQALLARRGGGSSLVGLSWEGGRIEAVEARAVNGTAEIIRRAVAPVSLNPLNHEPQLVGGELRKVLDEAGIRERRCAVCLPTGWFLTAQVDLPDLPEPDIESLLQLEAERGFPYSAEDLWIRSSQFRAAEGQSFATLIAVPRERVARLKRALAAAQLRPVTFTPAMLAIPIPEALREADALVLRVAGDNLEAALWRGDGIAALRVVEGAFESEGGGPRLQTDVLLREMRITLGQAPGDGARGARPVVVLGDEAGAKAVAEAFETRAASWNLRVVRASELPPETGAGEGEITPAVCLAARRLGEGTSPLEYLPPKVSRWAQFAERHSSKKLALTGAIAGAVAVIVALAFGAQQVQLWRWETRWNAMAAQVSELEAMQQNIRKYRPWFDESYRSLAILKRLTEAFPEDGAVTAKRLEIRGAATVICSGTASDRKTLLATLDRLGASEDVADIELEQMRGGAPLEFTFNFQWTGGRGQ